MANMPQMHIKSSALPSLVLTKLGIWLSAIGTHFIARDNLHKQIIIIL
jgi:hypothetical protein